MDLVQALDAKLASYASPSSVKSRKHVIKDDDDDDDHENDTGDDEPIPKPSTRRSPRSSTSSSRRSSTSSTDSNVRPQRRRRTVIHDDDDDDDDDDDKDNDRDDSDAMDIDHVSAKPTRILPARTRQPPKPIEIVATPTPKTRPQRKSKTDDVVIPATTTTTSSGRVVRKPPPATPAATSKRSSNKSSKAKPKPKSKSSTRGRPPASDDHDESEHDSDPHSDSDALSPSDPAYNASELARIESAFASRASRPMATQCAECRGPSVPTAKGRRAANPLFACARCSCAFHAECLPVRAKQSEYAYWVEGGEEVVCPYCVDEISAKVREMKKSQSKDDEQVKDPLSRCGLGCSYCALVVDPEVEDEAVVDVETSTTPPASSAADTSTSTPAAKPMPAPLLNLPAHTPAIHACHFRCTWCHRGAHYPCATRAMLATPDADLLDHTSEIEALDVLVTENQCAMCRAVADAPDVQVVLTWRHVPEDAPEHGAAHVADPEARKEYLVKFAKKSYRETMWVPASWLMSVAKSKWRAYLNAEKKQLADHPGMTLPQPESAVVDPLWRKPRKVLDIAGSEAKGDLMYLVQWHRQPASESTWVPHGSDGALEAMPEFVKAVDTYWRAQKIDSAADRAKRRHGPDYRPDPRLWGDGLSEEPKEIRDTGNKLMPHQLQGLNWLIGNWMGRWNCVLADEMGLGKTVQIVAFVQFLFAKHRRYPVLVVVPNSTLDNWEREFNKWAPQLHVVPSWGAAIDRELIAEKELFASVGSAKKPASLKCHVVLATYESVMAMDGLKRVHWDLLVVDEGHRLKNDESKLFKHLMELTFDHKILLTGTPLQNNLRELFNLMSFLEVEGFEDPEALAEAYDLDKKKVVGMSKEEEEALAHQASEKIRELHDMLRPHFLRRVKTDVVLDIPPKAEILVPVRMSPLQRQLIKDLYSKNFHLLKALGVNAARASNPSAALNNSSGLGGSSLSNLLLQCRKVLSHPFLLDNVEEGLTQAQHLDAVQKHLHLIDSCGKLALLAKMLPKLQADGHKILIFVQFQWTIKVISDFLYNMQTLAVPSPQQHPSSASTSTDDVDPGHQPKPAMRPFKYYSLDGTTNRNERQVYIDEFNSDPDAFAFILTTRAGGVGINLTAADTVVIYDVDWNPHQDLQAIARAHRIGQTKPVLAYKLMTLDSAEEKMVAVGRKKLVLDHVIVQRMGKDASETVSDSDLLDTLKFGASAVLDDDVAAHTDWQYTEEEIGRLLDRAQATEPANADNMSRAESPAPGETGAGSASPPVGSSSASTSGVPAGQGEKHQQGGGFGFSKVWLTRAPARAPAHALATTSDETAPDQQQQPQQQDGQQDESSAAPALANVDDLGLGEEKEGVQWDTILEKLKVTAPKEEENPFELGRRKRKAVNYADNVQTNSSSAAKKRKKANGSATTTAGSTGTRDSESADDDEFVPPPEIGRVNSSDDEDMGFDEAEVILDLERRRLMKQQRLAEAEAAVSGGGGALAGTKTKGKGKVAGSNGRRKVVMSPQLSQLIQIQGQTMTVKEALVAGLLPESTAREMGIPWPPLADQVGSTETAAAKKQAPRKVHSKVAGPTAQHAYFNAHSTKCWVCIGTSFETNTYHVPTQCPAISDRSWVEQEIALHSAGCTEVRMMMNANRPGFLRMVLDELVRAEEAEGRSENVAPGNGSAGDGDQEDRMDVDVPVV
ncbi:SNF2 family N-terminal domain-domain-containing protein [Catenaria anguillulae PL171]|uniref:SNF2 family N-terminal domain-domain-containing protein n=1 Tax=Catenaria anguillulae PL171 TaxID=765915 RepID=A0A1Y2HDE0_9FUNG|nr:SNF2 family N-terminal domain-domain-containing protein [Catenaria anguillulae PL171]